MTEREARETGRPLTIKVQRYADVAYGWAMEDSTGFARSSLIAALERSSVPMSSTGGEHTNSVFRHRFDLRHSCP